MGDDWTGWLLQTLAHMDLSGHCVDSDADQILHTLDLGRHVQTVLKSKQKSENQAIVIWKLNTELKI